MVAKKRRASGNTIAVDQLRQTRILYTTPPTITRCPVEIAFEQKERDYLLWGLGLLPLEFC
jgi:hypothetical protein